MIRTIVTYCLLLIIFLFTGCIDENTDGCLREITFIYLFELHDDNEAGDLFTEQVDHIHLYVYDQNGDWIHGTDISRTALDNGNSITIPFTQSGEYTFVSWGNIHTDDFFIEIEETGWQMKLGLSCVTEDGNLTKTDPGSLFHGITTIKTQSGTRSITEKVHLTKNSNVIRLEIAGVTDPANANLEVFITGRNGTYSYDNTIHPDSPEIVYNSEQWTEGEYIYARIPSYRFFAEDQEMQLIVRSIEPASDGVTYSYQESLVPLLLEKVIANHQLYLDRTEEFFVYITFDENGLGSGSTVSPWSDVDNNTEL